MGDLKLDVLDTLVSAEVKDKWDKLKRADLQKEKQWAQNVLYLFGHVNVIVRPVKNTFDDILAYEIALLKNNKRKIRTSNIILPQWRSLLARMLKNKAAIVVEPLTFAERDVAVTKVAQEVLEDWWFNVNRNNPILRSKYSGMYNVLRWVYAYILTYGECLVRPYFNPNTKTDVVIDGEIQEVPAGEVEVLVFDPFNYKIDPLNRYIIERAIMDAGDVSAMYGVEVKGEEIRLDGIEMQIDKALNYSTSGTVYSDAVIVYRYWERPSAKHPNGRLIITTPDKLLYQGELPEDTFGDLPHFHFTFQDLLFGLGSRGVVEDMISLQDDYNDTLTRIDKYKNQAGHLLAPRGSNIKWKFTDDQTKIIIYNPVGGEPKYMQPGSPPQFLFENLVRIKQDLQDITMTHDVTKARVPANVRSGYAIQLLQEKDEDELEPYLVTFEDKLAAMCNLVLKMMRKYYTETRILRITGDDKLLEVRKFTGTDLRGPWRIKIEFGSWLPQSKQARQEMVIKLVQFGVLTPEEAKKLLPLGNLDDNLMPIDYVRAKEELQFLLEGKTEWVVVRPYDNHKIHADVFREYMESTEYLEQDWETQRIIEQHYWEHVNALTALAQQEQAPPSPERAVAEQGGM